MKLDFIRKIMGIVLLGFLISLGFLQPVKNYLSIPQNITMFQGEATSVSSHLNVEQTTKAISTFKSNQSIQIDGNKPGMSNLLLSKGHIPVKKVDVKVLPELRVIPGGESIGVKLNTLGVLVVGYHLVNSTDGEVSPGEKAGIQVGDIITKINGEKIDNMEDVKTFVNQAGQDGQKLHLTVLRNDQKLQKDLLPLQDNGDHKYRIGLYIRDSAAGIGTMTFYDPKSGKYGALGHVISDMDTKKPIVVNNGEVLRSKVTAIDKGNNGHPGEKIGTFSANASPVGDIQKNTPFGIFGRLNTGLDNQIMNKGIPVALPSEVKEGPAKILTVIHGNKVEEFNIQIVSSIPQKFPATKGLVIKVTDPKLLKETGGIVQGMSGSPIIQNGKLIGAVTHVFVNDPTSGYGCHIEWMLDESGINIYQNQHERKQAS